MIAKTATRSSAAAPYGADNPLALVWQTMPLDNDERLRRITALGQRITKYVEFMCQAANSESASVEAKEGAVAVFYERLLLVERQLARIHDAFRLV
jgi:hypothetical protein